MCQVSMCQVSRALQWSTLGGSNRESEAASWASAAAQHPPFQMGDWQALHHHCPLTAFCESTGLCKSAASHLPSGVSQQEQSCTPVQPTTLAGVKRPSA